MNTIELGRQLLQLYFAYRSAESEQSSYVSASGVELPYHQERRRQYYSIFGKIPIWRPYFYRAGAGGAAPLDGELSLGEDSYSDLVREWSELLSVEVAYEKVHENFEMLLGQGLSSATMQGLVLTDAEAVEGYYEQKAPPAPATEGPILVVQAVKNNLKVDWTRAHRKDVYASVESAVKMVLRRRRVKGEQFRFLQNRLMKQAKALYEDWPLAA